jgi:hypothetical protein
MTNQMASGVHARVEPAPLLVDTDLGHASLYRSVDKMNDPVRILDDSCDLAFANPAGVTGLSATLGVKQCCAQHHGEFVLVRCAFQDFHIGDEVITMEKEAKRHVPCSYECFHFLLYGA